MLERFCEGKEEKEIIELFGGDSELVATWRSFLMHNHWMEKRDGKWFATKKGEKRTERYSYGLLNQGQSESA